MRSPTYRSLKKALERKLLSTEQRKRFGIVHVTIVGTGPYMYDKFSSYMLERYCH
jgi:hypothetical protein